MIYAIGDIHGEVAKLDDLLRQIRTDAADLEGSAHKIIFLGDYIDRGPCSAQVIDRLIQGVNGFQTVFLMGNHERMALDFLETPSTLNAQNWLLNGGTATLISYSVSTDEVRRALSVSGSRALKSIPLAHVEWMRHLKLTHRSGPYFFVHAGINPLSPIDQQEERDLLWIRNRFLQSNAFHGAIVVYGHTVTRDPDLSRNRIGIDTGCGRGGPLTCVVLDGEDPPRFLQSR